MLKKEKIYIPIYNTSVIVVYSTANEFDKWMIKNFNLTDLPGPTTVARTLEVTYKGKSSLVLWISSVYITEFNEYYFEFIPHEVLHLIGHISQFIGIKYDFDNDEPLAYLTGFLNLEIYLALKKYLK